MAKQDKDNDQILKGLLDTLVLYVLRDAPNYGFGIKEALHAQLGDDASMVKEATLYPLLHRLERRGLLISYRQPGARGTPRKYYKITAEGGAHLEHSMGEWQRVVTLLQRSVLAKK